MRQSKEILFPEALLRIQGSLWSWMQGYAEGSQNGCLVWSLESNRPRVGKEIQKRNLPRISGKVWRDKRLESNVPAHRGEMRDTEGKIE